MQGRVIDTANGQLSLTTTKKSQTLFMHSTIVGKSQTPKLGIVKKAARVTTPNKMIRKFDFRTNYKKSTI